MLVWCFVVLILVQSYTASLSSYLTVQQLQPMVSDVQELLRRGDNVGYQKESFVVDILRKLGFVDEKLVTYSSPEECDELFKKGSANGGIAAAFDEVPYMKLLMGQYCSKYTTKEPTFKTAGFGFVSNYICTLICIYHLLELVFKDFLRLQVFPLHSPFTPDVSKAILSVTESEKMKHIEAKYFTNPASCPDSSTIGSDSLGLESFWGLFLIAGIAALVALLLYTTTFIYKHRTILNQSDPSSTSWVQIQKLWTIFISRDLNHHTFKDKAGNGVNQYEYPSSSSDFSSSSPFEGHSNHRRNLSTM